MIALDHPGDEMPLPSLEPSPEEIAGLLAIRDIETFIERSYQRILGRAPDLRGGSKYAKLLKISPVHTRKRFLDKLLRSSERWWHCRALLEAERARLAGERHALGRRIREVNDHASALQNRRQDVESHRHLIEEQAKLVQKQSALFDRQTESAAEQRKLLESHKSIPGLHVRLLEQYRERYEVIDAIAGVKHEELEEHRVLFARKFDELGRLLNDFARQRQDLTNQRENLASLTDDLGRKRDEFDRQIAHQAKLAEHQSNYLEQLQILLEAQRRAPEAHAGLIEQIRIIPQLQADLLGEQRRVFDRQEREGDRRIEQVESLVRELATAFDQAEVLPMTPAPSPPAPPPPSRILDPTDPYLAEVELFVHESYRLILRRAPEPGELVEASDQLRSSVGKLKGEFLRSLLERQTQTEIPETQAIETNGSETQGCRICGGDLAYKWSRKVLHNRHVAHYHECVACEALQVLDPFWLAEAYAGEDTPLAENPDQGRFARNFSAYHYIAALGESAIVPARPMVLDFGGGYGILTQMLRSGGYEAWQADPHVPIPFLASDRGLGRLEDFPDGSFDLVTSLEVLEHLEDPQSVVDRLARLLKPTGTLMLSTTIYHPGEHDQNWFYLSTEWGQHITFWSRSALALCARRAGFKSLGFYPGGEGFFILFSRLDPEALATGLTIALEVVREGRLFSKITAPWDLQTMGYVRVLPEPVVISLDPESPRQQDARSGRGAA